MIPSRTIARPRFSRSRRALLSIAAVASAACGSAPDGENETATHSALAAHVATTPGVVRNAQFILRNSNTTGVGEVRFSYGSGSDVPIVGDWDGDGVQTPGVFSSGTFYLRNSNTAGGADIAFSFGDAGDVPVVGDWDGDGKQSVGVYRAGYWYLRNTNSSGSPDVSIQYGLATDVPVVGDWDGNGTETVGVVRGGNNWILRNSNVTAPGEIRFTYGNPSGDVPVTGDWDGNGTATPGVYRGGNWFLRNSNTTGNGEISFNYGLATDRPIPGSWSHVSTCPLSNTGYLDLQQVNSSRYVNGTSYAVLGEPMLVSLRFVSGDRTPAYHPVTVYLDGQPRTFTLYNVPGQVQNATIDGFMVDASTPTTHTLSWTTSCGTFSKTFSIVKENPTAPIVKLSASPSTITSGGTTTITATISSNVVSTCSTFTGTLTGTRVSDGTLVVDRTSNSETVWTVPQSPSGTTDYQFSAACQSNSSLRTGTSTRVTVNSGGGGGGGSTCQANGVNDVYLANGSSSGDVFSIWAQDTTNGSLTYVQDIGVGATVDYTAPDCHWINLIAVSANQIATYNSTFGSTYDPHQPGTALTVNFWEWNATFMGKKGGERDPVSIF